MVEGRSGVKKRSTYRAKAAKRLLTLALAVGSIVGIAAFGYHRAELCAQATGERRAAERTLAESPTPTPDLLAARDRALTNVQASCWTIPQSGPKR